MYHAAMRPPRFATVRDAELVARRRIPKSVYRAFSSGSGESLTLHENVGAFREVGFRPHAAVRHDQRGLATTILGEPSAMPVVVSPVGALRMAHRDAEAGAAPHARAMGMHILVST